jgi:D-alanyl-lipoteichoic acid acyltransferase DltB (MBOAT superfamily)
LERIGLQTDVPVLQLVLPVGISFYTFQTLGYTIDVYRKRLAAERNLETFALYVAYFPQLVAGPIERAQRLLPQFKNPRTPTNAAWHSAAQLILIGYFKKVFIADGLAGPVSDVFQSPESASAPVLLLAAYGFAVQIYCDFSGYTDIARGTSRLFGIELMENFRQPYFARNVSEFWRRWHISLSTWLRDYLYIPLGGNRVGPFRHRVNLMATMLLGGLWHGANWTFVLWGGLHGLYLVLHNMIRRPESPDGNRLAWFVFVPITFHCVVLTWIPFRASTIHDAWQYFIGLFSQWQVPDDAVAGLVLPLAVAAVALAVIDWPCWRAARELPFTERHAWWLRGFAYGIMLILLAFGREGSREPFIYFQF